jgi:hypothetical protein
MTFRKTSLLNQKRKKERKRRRLEMSIQKVQVAQILTR